MSFEVMLLDQYSVIDSPKRLELIGRLRSMGSVPHDELPDNELSAFLFDGARLFNEEIQSFDEVKPIEEPAILLWAAMMVTDSRLLHFAKYFLIDSRVGKTDPGQSVKNNALIKKELRQQFERYLDDSQLTLGDESILQGELIRRDIVIDAMVPTDVQHTPPKTTLQLLKKTDTTIDIQWTRATVSDFYSYVVYIDTLPEIEDKTRLSSALTNPGVREGLEPILVISQEQWQNAARLSDLTPDTVYWIVVGTTDYNGRIAISNELQVRTDA